MWAKLLWHFDVGKAKRINEKMPLTMRKSMFVIVIQDLSQESFQYTAINISGNTVKKKKRQ